MRKYWILLAALAPATVFAQSWLDEIANLDAQIELLERQKTRDDMLQERAFERADRLPRVLAVSGRPGEGRALIRYSSGRTGSHRVNDELLPGIRVLEIARQGVKVTAPRGASQRELWLDFAPAELPMTDASAQEGQFSAVYDAIIAQPPRISP